MWKVPIIIATGIICFGLGALAGVGGMLVIKPDWSMKKQESSPPPDSSDMSASGPPMGMMGGAGGGGGGGRGGGGRGGGGGGGPSPKVQLTTLVNKLEVLSTKPLTIKLNEDQQKKLAEQLQGLDEKEELTDEDAKTRLEAILEIVKDDKATLESAGYRWPGGGGGGPGGGRGGAPGGGRGGFGGGAPPDVPKNPFKDVEENNKHLKSLQEQLSKAKP